MNHNFSNEDGIAYGIVMAALFFAVAGVLWLCFSYDINMMIEIYFNGEIAAGHVSQQRLTYVNFLVNMWRYAVPVFLLGGFIWAVRRAVYKKEGGD